MRGGGWCNRARATGSWMRWLLQLTSAISLARVARSLKEILLFMGCPPSRADSHTHCSPSALKPVLPPRNQRKCDEIVRGPKKN